MKFEITLYKDKNKWDYYESRLDWNISWEILLMPFNSLSQRFLLFLKIQRHLVVHVAEQISEGRFLRLTRHLNRLHHLLSYGCTKMSFFLVRPPTVCLDPVPESGHRIPGSSPVLNLVRWPVFGGVVGC